MRSLFWQYGAVVHDKPNMSIGANHISLNDVEENYEQFGVCKKEFKHLVRQPLEEELPDTIKLFYIKQAALIISGLLNIEKPAII